MIMSKERIFRQKILHLQKKFRSAKPNVERLTGIGEYTFGLNEMVFTGILKLFYV